HGGRVRVLRRGRGGGAEGGRGQGDEGGERREARAGLHEGSFLLADVETAQAYAGDRAHSKASRTSVAAEAAISCSDAHSRTEWNSWPPVNRFGVGSPRWLSTEPSVPPRIGVRTGSMPSARIAASARPTISGCPSR